MSERPIIKRRRVWDDTRVPPDSDKGGSVREPRKPPATVAAKKTKPKSKPLPLVLIVCACCIGSALPVIGYVAYAKGWFAPANQTADTNVAADRSPDEKDAGEGQPETAQADVLDQDPKPGPGPEPPAIEIDEDAIVKAVRAMGDGWRRAVDSVINIYQLRAEIRNFKRVGLDGAAENAEQAIQAELKNIKAYMRACGEEAENVMLEADIDLEKVLSILRGELQKAKDKGYAERHDAIAFLLQVVKKLPDEKDSYLGHVLLELKKVFPKPSDKDSKNGST